MQASTTTDNAVRDNEEAIMVSFREGDKEAFRWVYRVALAFERTGDVQHLVGYAESLRTTVALESSTDIRQRIRESRDRTPTPADPADVEALIRRLEA